MKKRINKLINTKLTEMLKKKLVSSLGGIPDDLGGDILIDFGNDVLGADIIDDLGDDILRDTVQDIGRIVDIERRPRPSKLTSEQPHDIVVRTLTQDDIGGDGLDDLGDGILDDLGDGALDDLNDDLLGDDAERALVSSC